MTNSRQVAESRQDDQELDSVGMPPVDGQLYSILVRHPRSTAAELSEQCGMSVQLVSRALSRLTASGMTSRVPGRPPRYLAVAPDIALGGLLARKEAELRGARATVRRLTELFREASRFTHPAELVEVVTGLENIDNRVGHLQAAARIEIKGFDKSPYVRSPGNNHDAEHRRLTEGISYRVIYDREALAWPGRLARDILPSAAQGEHARVRPDLPMKLIMADERMAIIPITSSEHIVDAAYVIHPSALLEALVTLFDAEWERALPLAHATGKAPAPADVPDEDTRALLVLLAAGHTDAGISRSLGWSLRTTQRRVHQLLTDLNATTRFQAGIAANALGWL